MNDKNKKSVSAEQIGQKTEIAIIDERMLRDKIYEVRGVKVMLDFELAEIYGYETKSFNRQVKNNAKKFEGDDFMFQLTRDELDEISRCKNFTSIQTKGIKGGRSNLPYAFTEQGVYMLMTVLKGELAVKQSRALVKAFKKMKDYIVQNQYLIDQRDYLRLSMQVSDTQQAVHDIQNQMIDQGDRINELFGQMQDTVKKSEIAPFLLDFSKPKEQREYIFLNGQPVKADVTYMDIYSQANHSIHIVDDYINIKTLHLLQDVKQGVTVTIFSDNNYNKLHASDYADFQREFPNISIDVCSKI